MAHDTIPDSHRDLLDARFATLATVGEDGYPQVSEVWFLSEGGLLTEPNCTAFILDLTNPYRSLEIRCTSTRWT